jgi:hypothetical protein
VWAFVLGQHIVIEIGREGSEGQIVTCGLHVSIIFTAVRMHPHAELIFTAAKIIFAAVKVAQAVKIIFTCGCILTAVNRIFTARNVFFPELIFRI